MTVLPLSRATLPMLRRPVHVPIYDPADVRAGIVHLGLGGFHRAHMARYTHDLMNLRPDALRWGIVGVGLLPADRAMHEALAPQDSLYTLVERQGVAETVTVIGSLRDTIFAGDSSRRALAAMVDSAVGIVSLTVTENGYCLNRATKQLDLDHPIVTHDLATPADPRSAIGILVEAYRRRRAAQKPAFTSLSCDNIEDNGHVLRRAVLTLADRQDASLAAWIEAEASFPNTMVDRITPATVQADVEDLVVRHSLRDRWPVFSEAFRQWVIEDDFVAGRPAWEEVGAQFVTDVAPYEKMKLRLLNASHLAIAGLGRLMGYVRIDEALRDDGLRAYMTALMERETGPTLSPVPGVDLAAYKASLVERFANNRIKDTVDRVNTDAPVNLLLDPIRDRLRAGLSIELLAIGLAAWCRRVRGTDEAGRPSLVLHPLAEVLRAKAVEGGPDPRPLLSIEPLFGELARDRTFVAVVKRSLEKIYELGARAALSDARREFAF